MSDRAGSEPTTARQRSSHRAIAASRSEKVSKTVARLIVKDIAARRLGPGSPLPPEQQMAQHYKVGRPSIREALRLLEAQGLVVIRQGLGGGPLVGQPDGVDFGETLTMYLHAQGVRFREILEAAAEMDGLAAAMVARRVADGEEIEIDELLAAGKRDLPSFLSDDDMMATAIDFHDLMRRMAGNYVIDLMGSGVAHIFTDRTIEAHHHRWSAEERTMIAREHRAIAMAIKQGSVERARRLATAHLRAIGEMITRDYPGVYDEIVDWR